jgi:hypothetical protein
VNHNDIFDGLNAIQREANEILSMANAFDRVGNASVASELREVAACIRAAHDQIRNAYASEIGRNFERGQQATGTMIEAVLAGMALTQKSV